MTFKVICYPNLSFWWFQAWEHDNFTHMYTTNWRLPRQLTDIVYLQIPRVFQSLMVLSREPDTICLLSAENATDKTSAVWSMNVLVDLPLEKKKKQSARYETWNINCIFHDIQQNKRCLYCEFNNLYCWGCCWYVQIWATAECFKQSTEDMHLLMILCVIWGINDEKW